MWQSQTKSQNSKSCTQSGFLRMVSSCQLVFVCPTKKSISGTQGKPLVPEDQNQLQWIARTANRQGEMV